jgi:RimK family alpha-L-glutamate ligase
MTPVLGVGRTDMPNRSADALLEAARARGIRTRAMELARLRTRIDDNGVLVVEGEEAVEVTHLAPVLLYFAEHAAIAWRALIAAGARSLNDVDAMESADDKARTALELAVREVPQVRSWVGPQDPSFIVHAEQFPFVLKRTHGAQGRWVRPVRDHHETASAYQELAAEGRGAFIVQPLVSESYGRSLRLIVVAGRVVACTERRAAPGELHSNISHGGSQRAWDPDSETTLVAIRAARALRLGYAGVDILMTSDGPRVLEVNAAPDFTSMAPYTSTDIAGEVLDALLAL